MVNALNIYPVPSISKAKRNALAVRGGELKNRLAEKQLRHYDQDREAEAQTAKRAAWFKSVNLIKDIEDPETRKQLWVGSGQDADMLPEFSQKGEDSSIEFRQEDESILKVTGSTKELGLFIPYAANNPNILSPENMPITMKHLQDAGVTFERIAAKDKNKKGFTLSPGQKRYDPEGEIIAESKKTPDKLTKTEAQAEITEIEESIYDVESGQDIMQRLKGLPGFQSLMSEKAEKGLNRQEAKERILEYYENRLDELYKIVGKERPASKKAPTRLIYKRGEGFVEK